ncbi:septum formation family protein [Leifsonia sp. NPDC058292]|uniref:septum formation family protein n=1 Tax=Leifsonia sp. NPDC058292 TaxID=3346428 RepID=UPI0036DCFDF4
MTSTRRRRSIFVATAIALAATMGLSGCVPFLDQLREGIRERQSQSPSTAAPTPGDDGSSPGDETSDGVYTANEELLVGDCVNDLSDSADGYGMPVVDCETPHDSEVYAIASLGHGDYPGEDETDALAETTCHDAFAPYVGVSADVAVVDWSYYAPGDEESWNDDDTVICVAFIDEEQATGSVKGTAQRRDEQNS